MRTELLYLTYVTVLTALLWVPYISLCAHACVRSRCRLAALHRMADPRGLMRR
jgi:hypothetical protein